MEFVIIFRFSCAARKKNIIFLPIFVLTTTIYNDIITITGYDGKK